MQKENKGGRPRKSDEEKKANNFGGRLNNEEAQFIDALCERLQTDKSNLFRSIVQQMKKRGLDVSEVLLRETM